MLIVNLDGLDESQKNGQGEPQGVKCNTFLSSSSVDSTCWAAFPETAGPSDSSGPAAKDVPGAAALAVDFNALAAHCAARRAIGSKIRPLIPLVLFFGLLLLSTVALGSPGICLNLKK
jgi:hypothetical protein